MNIQPIVEGHGEVAALPVLLRRLRDESQNYSFDINPPIRRKRSELVRESELRRSIKLARLQRDCGAILILFDSDDDCPKTFVTQLQKWAESEAAPLPCSVVLAHREYEAWFLAAIESLRGVRGIRPDAESHPEPESPRDAKGRIEERMLPSRSYSETADQPALSAKFDLSIAHRRCRSFRKLVKSFGTITNAMGVAIGDWPPPAWFDQS